MPSVRAWKSFLLLCPSWSSLVTAGLGTRLILIHLPTNSVAYEMCIIMTSVETGNTCMYMAFAPVYPYYGWYQMSAYSSMHKEFYIRRHVLLPFVLVYVICPIFGSLMKIFHPVPEDDNFFTCQILVWQAFLRHYQKLPRMATIIIMLPGNKGGRVGWCWRIEIIILSALHIACA